MVENSGIPSSIAQPMEFSTSQKHLDLLSFIWGFQGQMGNLLQKNPGPLSFSVILCLLPFNICLQWQVGRKLFRSLPSSMASCSRSKSQCVDLSWSNSFASKNMFGFLRMLWFVYYVLFKCLLDFVSECVKYIMLKYFLVIWPPSHRSDKEYPPSKKSCAAMVLELQCNHALEVSNAAIPSALQRKMLRCFNFFTVRKSSNAV